VRRGRAGSFICGALSPLALWACGPSDPAGAGNNQTQAARPDYCDSLELCIASAQPPIDLRPAEAALRPSHRDYALVQAAIASPGGGTIHLYERTDGGEPPNERRGLGRLYLVRLRQGGEALVIVRSVAERWHALLIRRGAGLSGYRLRTDANLSLWRFALLDPATGVGDTFELRQLWDNEMFSYATLAPGSPEIRTEYLWTRGSSCRVGPLTATPPEWAEEYRRSCGP
jgi:hypothetical protein